MFTKCPGQLCEVKKEDAKVRLTKQAIQNNKIRYESIGLYTSSSEMNADKTIAVSCHMTALENDLLLSIDPDQDAANVFSSN